MPNDAKLVAYAAILTWVMIMTAAGIRTRGSFFLALGNRDDVKPPTALSGRADRAAANMVENLVLFIVAFVAAKAAGASGWKVERGAQIFLAARALYFPVYLLGIKVVRTTLWSIACVGMGLLVIAALTA
jgi:uncharacterized MAPEG superfamily protein